MERCLGGRILYRGAVCGRKIPDRDLPRACRQGEHLRSGRIARDGPDVDILLGPELSVGRRVDAGLGAPSGPRRSAQGRRGPNIAGPASVKATTAESRAENRLLGAL